MTTLTTLISSQSGVPSPREAKTLNHHLSYSFRDFWSTSGMEKTLALWLAVAHVSALASQCNPVRPEVRVKTVDILSSVVYSDRMKPEPFTGDVPRYKPYSKWSEERKANVRKYQRSHKRKPKPNNASRTFFAAKIVAQNNLCALCGLAESMKGRFGAIRQLSVDHNHETGEFRALLCTRCNWLVGHFERHPLANKHDLWRRLEVYLRETCGLEI